MIEMKTLVFLFCFILGLLAESLDFDKVHFIDKIGNNLLFRGNMPKNSSNVFAFDDLISFMTKRAQSEAKTVFPSKFKLIDISFLSDLLPSEYEDLKLEEKFFQNYPQIGQFIHWGLIGDLTSPNIYPEFIRKEMAQTLAYWQLDSLVDRIGQVYDILKNQTDIPNVIYYHCEGGADRTGEFSASIYMQYKNMTLADALALDYQIAKRTIGTTEQWAAEWYCYYLKYGLNYPLTCSTS